MCERVMRKNNNLSHRPLTISAQYGLIDQRSFFNKTVASPDLSNYTLIKEGEFAYNKSSSSEHPWGSVKCLTIYSEGALSPLYICFAPKHAVIQNWLVQYYESSKWHKEISEIATEGARNHGLLNVSVPDFFQTKLHIPSKAEQRKIAGFLSLLDERIAAQRALIGEMGRLIGGIAEKVYRGKDDSYGKLGDFLEQVSERNRDGKITNILSVSNKYGFVRQSEQFSNRTLASEDTSCYKVVTKDDFAYNPARINVGSIARLDTEESGIVSPMYICFHIKHSLNPIFLSNYFKSSKFQEQINRRLEGSVRQCLTFESLCEIPIPVPNMAFQNIASDAFVSLQSKLMNERAFLASLEKQKQYLLQKLFI